MWAVVEEAKFNDLALAAARLAFHKKLPYEQAD